MTEVTILKLKPVDHVEFGVDTSLPGKLPDTVDFKTVESTLGAHLSVQASDHVTVAAKVAKIFGDSPAASISVKITF